MISLTKSDQMLKQMVSQVSEQMKAANIQDIAYQTASPAQRKIIDDFHSQVQQIMSDSVSWEKLKALMIQVYSETYTEDEIDGILAFYKSPAGQAFLAKTPELATKTMGLIQKQTADVQSRLREAEQEFNRKMKELGPPPER